MKHFLVVVAVLLLSLRAPAQDEPQISHPELRAELLEMVRVDQAARTRLPIDVDEMMSVDQKNTSRLIEIVEESGWPTISMVSEDGAQAAWLLAQHADQIPSFQADVLLLMEQLLESNEVSRSNYAYLYDRTHTPQRYGTQGAYQGPGIWAPLEIEDPRNVDKRRTEMGITMSLAEYTSIAHRFCK